MRTSSNGTRCRKLCDGRTRFLYDGNNLLRELDDLGTVEAEFTYVPQPYAHLISQQRDGDSSFYHFDGTRNTAALTDAAGVTTDEYEHDAWGKLRSSTGSTPNAHTYKGELLAYHGDPHAGPEDSIYSLHHRDYVAQQGRLRSEDPAADDLNLYRYSGNDPINRADPSGLAPPDTQPGFSESPVGEFLRKTAYVIRSKADAAASGFERWDQGKLRELEAYSNPLTDSYVVGRTFTTKFLSGGIRLVGDAAAATVDFPGTLEASGESIKSNVEFATEHSDGDVRLGVGLYAAKQSGLNDIADGLEGRTIDARPVGDYEARETLVAGGVVQFLGTVETVAAPATVLKPQLRRIEVSTSRGLPTLENFTAPGSEGFAVPRYDRSSSYNFERHANEFIHDWNAEPILNDYAQRRMQELGVRPAAIGIMDDVETGSAFSMEHNMGGRNSRPAWQHDVTKGGINIDYGVFDENLRSFPSWKHGSLRDRIDAVIIHELCEYNSRRPTTGSRHDRAIMDAPSTTKLISPGARKILEDYRVTHETNN